eukprot:XP_020402658.1 magnesium transporter MRS2-F-like [Zea mays]
MEGESSIVASPFPVPSSSKGHEMEMTKKTAVVVPEMTSSSSMPNLAVAKDGNTKVLPFEFRALEVCLESACRSLEEEPPAVENVADGRAERMEKPSDPPIAPPVDDGKSVVPDENLKKRKNTETNGYLQNNLDMRPTKLPRPALPSNCVENAYDEALEVRRLQDKAADFSGGSVALFMGQGKLESIYKVRDGAPNIAKEEDKKSDRHEKKKRK